MKKLTLLVAMLAMVVMLVVAAPAMAQDAKAAKAQAKAAKAEAKNKNKTAEMPKTGGAPVNAALLGLGGATIVVGGGLLVRRIIR
ncbi:MAG: hypothetical protein LC751_12580 [Actinobacteria bacterium]|nr:hypothetical protein [Actinomycetota bacterium]MCA1737392.1 hypothetical protein [Actinomycetota bacterium]